MKCSKKPIKLDYRNKLIKNKNNIYYIYDKISKRKVFINDEVMKYISKAEEFRLNEVEFVNCFEDQDDRIYIDDLLSILKRLGFIENEAYNIEFNKKNKINFRVVHLLLTNRCNLKCKHCSNFCGPEGNDILNTSEIKNIISNIKNFNPRKIVFTGGEPLLRNDLEEIVRYAKKELEKTKFSLSTNGILINEKNILMIKELFDSIDISIDGVNEESCSRVRGKGVFNKVIDSVHMLKENGINDISLSMIFGTREEHLKEEFIALNKELGTIPICRAFKPKGRGYENREIFNKNEGSLPISITNIYDKNKNHKLSKRISTCACDAFENSLYIDANGDCYACPSLDKKEYKIMNLAKENIYFEYIKERMDLIKKQFTNVLEYKGSKCEKCDLNIFCWSCPADFINAEDNDEIDIWCDLMKDKLEKIVWG